MTSLTGNACLGPDPIGATIAEPARSSWPKVVRKFREKLRRHRQLHDLEGLDDRLLADIGITRGQVGREAERFYWALFMA